MHALTCTHIGEMYYHATFLPSITLCVYLNTSMSVWLALSTHRAMSSGEQWQNYIVEAMKSCKQVSFDHLGVAGNSDIFDVTYEAKIQYI